MKKGPIISIALIASAALGGYVAGRSSRAPLTDTVMKWQQESAVDDLLSAPEDGHASDAAARHARAKKLKERFLSLWSSADQRNGDLDTTLEGQRVLDQLSTGELAEFCRASPEDFSLRARLLDEWIMRDAPAALDTAIHLFAEKGLIMRCMQTWRDRDPEALIAWMRIQEMPPQFAEAKATIRVNLIMDLTREDFSRAEQELPYLEKNEMQFLLKRLAAAAGADPEKSAHVKELAAKYAPAYSAELEKTSFRAMAGRDPEAAAQHLEAIGLSGSERTEMEVTYLEGMVHRPVKEAYQAWMDIRDPASPIPERVWDGFNSNFIFKPDEMRGWLDTLEPGPVRDAFYEKSLSHLAAHGHFDQAAKFTTTIEDSAIRSAALKSLQKLWTQSNAEAAKSWSAGLPESDRAALEH
ncbi:hypothetical protein [Luteolibacter luteus]|uniref:Uncharacterized protein n=1 Tax=Luteolibacter luteus TaxID=2728835 RepID=A0A858RCR2_9BACT|nr:hypothetical protein [Luteolibacter luteus]QJE94394.1 hypothetical protein HHL09_00865 [Luteolibacter luteus]